MKGLTICCGVFYSAVLAAQAEPNVQISPANSFVFGIEYAPTSKHIFLGENEQRRLAQVTLTYRRRLAGNAWAEWAWAFEGQPFLAMSEPIAETTLTFSSGTASLAPVRVPKCTAGTVLLPGSGPFSPQKVTTTCGSITDFGAGVQPLGQHIRLLPFSRIGPIIEANAGIVAFSRNIPSDFGRRLNFTFSGGAGLEYELGQRRWIAAEYRVQHISNAYTAPDNSGIDQQVFRLSYTQGR